MGGPSVVCCDSLLCVYECECVCTPWLTPSVSPSHVWHQVTVRGLCSVSRLAVCVLHVFSPWYAMLCYAMPCHAMADTKCVTIPCPAPSVCPFHVRRQVFAHPMSGTKWLSLQLCCQMRGGWCSDRSRDWWLMCRVVSGQFGLVWSVCLLRGKDGDRRKMRGGSFHSTKWRSLGCVCVWCRGVECVCVCTEAVSKQCRSSVAHSRAQRRAQRAGIFSRQKNKIRVSSFAFRFFL